MTAGVAFLKCIFANVFRKVRISNMRSVHNHDGIEHVYVLYVSFGNARITARLDAHAYAYRIPLK